jgi:hypothetical protein
VKPKACFVTVFVKEIENNFYTESVPTLTKELRAKAGFAMMMGVLTMMMV